MDGIATSDYIYSYPDVVLSPDTPEPGGIYTLEESGKRTDPWSRTTIPNRYSSDLLMRGDPHGWGGPSPHGGRAEKFSQREYAEGLPMQYPGRSARWDRPAVDDVMWDERPRSFRSNASNQHAELFIPPQLRPWGGGPSPYLAFPVYSPSRAVSVVNREPFAGAQANDSAAVGDDGSDGGGANATKKCSLPHHDHHSHHSHSISPKALEVGLQMVKVVLFLIIIILLAMWLVMSTLSARRDEDLKRSIREALAAIKA